MSKIFNKEWLILFVLISLLIVLSPSIIVAQKDEEIFENIKLPSNVEELVQSFNYMSYDVVVLRNGQKSQDSTIEYDYLGKDKVDAVETDKVSFVVQDKINEDIPSDMLFWFEGTDIKKMKIDGEIISAQMAGVMGDRLLSAIFSPFYSLSNYDIQKLSKVGKVSHSQEKFGGEEVKVTIVEVENIPEYEIESGTIKLVKYEGMSFVTSFNYISSTEDLVIDFDVNEIKFN